MGIWQNVGSEGQSPDLHVVKQYIYGQKKAEIVAQIWYHAAEGIYSMNTYEDPTLLDGAERFGTLEELIEKAEKIFV